MKKIKNILPLVVFSLLVASCEENIKTWSGADRINFVTISAADTVRNYSFVFQAEDVLTDIVWLEVQTQGMVVDYPRTVRFKAVKPFDGIQAEPGKHYVDFESDNMSEELKAMYVIPAGKDRALIPIVLMRNASLKSETVQLRIVFDEENNEYFKNGFSGVWSHRTIIFTDILSRPQLWDDAAANFFGDYGPVKHRFMIETSGQIFDDEWINNNFKYTETVWNGDIYPSWDANDPDYMDYLARWLQRKLNEENERRKEVNGGVDDPLKEDDGTPVVIFK